MPRLRTGAWAALPLTFLLPLLAAGPAAASPTGAQLPYGGVQSVRPGALLTVTAGSGQAANGDTVDSPVFLAPGRLRMMTPVLTTTVAIACDAKPGAYPVTLSRAGDEKPTEHPARWARVRVQPADDAARQACRDKLKHLPAADREEHWAADTSWPQSDWDVRGFPAGSHVTITDNEDEGLDGQVTLSSSAFTGRPTLRGARAVLTGTATLRCDAAPGLYAVYRHLPGQDQARDAEPWARLRVTGAARASACSAQAAARSHRSPRTTWVAWAAAGGALLASAALLLRLRSRRRA